MYPFEDTVLKATSDSGNSMSDMDEMPPANHSALRGLPGGASDQVARAIGAPSQLPPSPRQSEIPGDHSDVPIEEVNLFGEPEGHAKQEALAQGIATGDGKRDSTVYGLAAKPTKLPSHELTDFDLRIQLLGGLDGIMGVMVRKQNLKRMGLLLSDGPDCRLLPFKHFPKKDVLQEIASRGNESDWTDHKTVIKYAQRLKGCYSAQAYPLDKLLLVRDDPGNYGANYLMPFSEMAYQAVHEAVLAAQADAIATKEEEVKRQLLSDGEANIRLRNEEFDAPQSPRQWQSETSAITAAEIAAMTIKTKRALLKQTVIKDGHTLNVTAPVQPFTGQPLLLRAPKVRVDVLLSCVAQSIAVQDSLSVDLKQELEFGIQAVPPTAERCCQAAGLTVKAVEMQHDSSALSRKAGVSTFTSRKNLKTFFSAVESMMEEALQQNEAVDVLKEEYMPLEESGNAEEHVKKSGSYLTCSPSRIRKNIGKSLILIWSLQEPLAPQHIFEAPADVTTLCFVHVAQRGLYLVAGLISGQIVVWDASFLWCQQMADRRPSLISSNSVVLPGSAQSSLLSSAIDYSHKRPVQHIKPLPASLDFRRSLAIYFNPKAESTHVLSCGADGGIFVWDIATAVANAEHAEFLWKPVLQCQLRKQDTVVLEHQRLPYERAKAGSWELGTTIAYMIRLRSLSAFTSSAFPPQVTLAELGAPLGLVCCSSVESMAAWSYLAVGDAVGSLRVLRLLPSLSTPYPEELSNISTMLLNEDERLDYLNFRKPIHAKATELHKKSLMADREAETLQTSVAPETECPELESLERAYRDMESAFLEDLEHQAKQQEQETAPTLDAWLETSSQAVASDT
ncbi:putative hypothtetical protein, conserved [Cyclospora cayetanensis]|uniref:Hypothtetical protein, conserved n=1 Tax=Cyclospora cayetanensis TaxID=88456 RepID=A0A1D3D689_9EIME|nr:putative hypothtetical protein, conserved [Cyclospora cayetanensis]